MICPKCGTGMDIKKDELDEFDEGLWYCPNCGYVDLNYLNMII